METMMYNGVMYYKLYCEEPLLRNTQHRYWHHKECGGDIYIGSDATLYCPKCGAYAPAISLELYDSDVGGRFIISLADLIGMMMSMVHMTGNQWMAEFFMNLNASVKSNISANNKIIITK